jgi:geranylgeranyl diphosphate synthase type II
MDRMHQASFERTNEGLIHEVLGEYGSLIRERIQAYLPQEEPKSYLYALLADYPQRSGKMLRSSLCIAMARATGASVEDAMASAVAIEFMHNASLVHDDIEDDSIERRGEPTLHALHGVPLALNAGDAMGLLSMRPLKSNFRRLGTATAMRIFEEMERVAWQSAEGQAHELGWQRDNRTDVTEEDYLAMVLQKTCWMSAILPLRVGCLIGTRGRLPLDPLIQVGFFFGAAFQIQDDILNLEPGSGYGKEINGDLIEGKRTLMIIHALRHSKGTERRRLVGILSKPRQNRTADDVVWIRGILKRHGSITYARSMALGLAGAALFEFDRYFANVPDSRDLRFMRELLTWVMQRSH